MGTRGTITIIYKGRTIKIYNHLDSYPAGLGQSLVDDIKKILELYGLEWLRDKVLNIKIVNNGEVPSEIVINELAVYTDLDVSKKSTSDWYCLLRKTQGSLINLLNAGYALEYDDDGEYNYVIDLDENQFTFNETETIFILNKIPDNWQEMV